MLMSYINNGDDMRKYFLFNINKDFKRVYRNNPYGLYKTLENMYNIKKIKYEVALYNEICNLVDNDVISSYIEHSLKFNKKYDKYLIDNYLIELNRSCVVVESNYNIPRIFMCLNI